MFFISSHIFNPLLILTISFTVSFLCFYRINMIENIFLCIFLRIFRHTGKQGKKRYRFGRQTSFRRSSFRTSHTTSRPPVSSLPAPAGPTLPRCHHLFIQAHSQHSGRQHPSFRRQPATTFRRPIFSYKPHSLPAADTFPSGASRSTLHRCLHLFIPAHTLPGRQHPSFRCQLDQRLPPPHLFIPAPQPPPASTQQQPAGFTCRLPTSSRPPFSFFLFFSSAAFFFFFFNTLPSSLFSLFSFLSFFTLPSHSYFSFNLCNSANSRSCCFRSSACSRSCLAFSLFFLYQSLCCSSFSNKKSTGNEPLVESYES